MPKRPNWSKKRKVNTCIYQYVILYTLAAELKRAEDQKAKLEADKKGKYLDNFKCKLLDLAAELKKAEDQKAKLEADKKGKYLD